MDDVFTAAADVAAVVDDDDSVLRYNLGAEDKDRISDVKAILLIALFK